jgi:hypothetical protein
MRAGFVCRSGLAAIVLLVSCTSLGESCPSSAACVGPARELYYKETVGIEPWASSADGSMPGGWREAVMSDLESAGLVPSLLEAVKVDGGGPTLFALQVRVPDDERTLAVRHCFVEDVRDSSAPAAQRTDCAPFYAAKP